MAMLSLYDSNHVLQTYSEQDRIRWAVEAFGEGLVLTTSFGTYAAVMLHLVRETAPDTPILSVDTGRNRETLDFADSLISMLGLQVEQYHIPVPPDGLNAGELPDGYLQQKKVEILESALREHGAKAWMSGVQRNETDHRREFDFLMQRADGLYKFHPLLDWDSRRLFAYCKEHGLPVNDHYFDPAKGRDQKQECGIHLTGMANVSFTSSEL